MILLRYHNNDDYDDDDDDDRGFILNMSAIIQNVIKVGEICIFVKIA